MPVSMDEFIRQYSTTKGNGTSGQKASQQQTSSTGKQSMGEFIRQYATVQPTARGQHASQQEAPARASATPVIPEAEQRRQSERETASTSRANARTSYTDLRNTRDSIKAKADDMMAEYDQKISAGASKEDLADEYAKIMKQYGLVTDYDKQVEDAYAALKQADQEYKDVYAGYNAARREVKEAKRNLRDVEATYSGWATDDLSAQNIAEGMNNAEDVKAARTRLASAREAYIEQGGNPDANIVSAGLKGFAAGVVDTAGYLQELNQPGNGIKFGFLTIGGGDDRMPAEMRAAIAQKQKEEYEAKHGAGTWIPTYQRTQDTAARLARESAEETASMKAGRNELGQFAVDMGVQGVQMGADAVTGKVLPGGSLTAMALRTFGSGVREARENGASIYQQGLYGAGTAAVEVLTEKMFGLTHIYGANMTDSLVSHAIGKFTSNRLGQAALGMVADALGEGLEEVISDIANPILKTIYNDKTIRESFRDNWDWSEVLYDFAVGAAMGFVGGSVEGVTEATGLSAPDAQSEFFMKAGENGMSFGEAIRDWKSLQQVSGASVEAQTDAAFDVLTGKESLEQQQERQSNALQRWGLTEEEAKNYIDTGRVYNPLTVSARDRGTITLGGKEVKIVSAKGEDVTVEQNGEKKNVKLDELEGMSESYKRLVQAAAESEYGEAVLRLYNPGQDVDAYTKAWSYAEDVFGAQTNISLEKARENPLLKDLTDGQLKFALELGRQRYDASKATAAQRAAQFKAARQEALKNGAFARKKGTVNTKGGTFVGRTVKGVDVKKLSTSQKKLFAMTQALADAVNINFVVYDGEANEGGSYIKGGTVMVNINSGQLSGKNLGAASLSHELTHYLQDFSPEEYGQLKDFITSEILKASPEKFAQLVQKQMDLEPNISPEAAGDEVIANACQIMLLNSEAINQLARQNMSLAERISDWISETAKKIKAAYKSVDLNDNVEIYEAVRAISGVMDEAQKLWDKALLAADASYNAVEQTGMRSASDTSGEAQNMYLGERAREADTTALDAAREMEKKGESAETIRQKTGWFRGMDGKWRFEIDDSKIKWESAGDIQFRKDHPEYDEYRNLLDKMCNSPELLTEDEQKRLVELDDMWSGELSRLSQRVKNGRVKLGNVLRHESLFRNYPGLKDVYIEFADLGTSNGQLVARSDGDSVIQINRSQRADPRSTLIHEIQHAIQHIEGFSTGSSPDAWSRRLDSGYAERRRAAEIEAADQKYRDLFDNAPEELKSKIRELNRAKLDGDVDLWDQIEAELYDGPYADRFVEIDKADFERRRVRDQQRVFDSYELYRNTAGEIEARDVQYRQRYDAEKRKNTPPDLGDENTVFADAAEKAQEIKKAVGNKPFVEIQDDILSGVAQKDWISTVWNTLQAKFPGAIRIGNSNVLIDKQSRDELTRSKSTGYLARNNQQMYEDKLRSMYNADELLKATTDWINEKVNHARKDKIVDFARGHVLFRVGSNDYVGEVVVGNRANGEMILYDIVRIQPTTITAKEVDVRDARNPLPENSRLQTSASSVNSISDSYAKSNPQNLDEEQHQRWGMAETDEEREARRESVANLKAENRILRARAEYWKGQTQQTRERTVRQQDTDRLANDLLREYESRTDKAEIKSDLKALGDYLVQSEALDYEELHDRAEDIADRIIDGNYTLIDDSNKENLDRLKGFLKGTALNLSASDFSDTGDEGFRKRYGRYFTVRENGRSIDSAWGELAGMFGEGLFPEDTYAPGDMLRMIGDYLDLWRPQYGNIFENARGEAVDAVTNEIIDRVLSEDVRQTPATYADKAQQKLNAQIAKDRARLDALREQKNARIEEIKREAAEKNMQIRIAEKAAKYEATAKVKQHYLDMLQRQRDTQKENAGQAKYRAQVTEKAAKLQKMLLTNSDKVHVPEALKGPLAEFLSSIDFSSKSMLRTGTETKADAKFQSALAVLSDIVTKQERYINGEEAVDDDLGGYLDVSQESMDYLRDTASEIHKMMQTGQTFTVNSMTAEQLKGLSKLLSNLTAAIRNMNNFMANERYASIREAADQDIQYMERLGSASNIERGSVISAIGWENGTPYYVFKRFGEGAKSVFDSFTKGWEKMAINMKEIVDFTEKAYTDKEVQTWQKEMHDITLSDGQTIHMTTAQLMEFSQLLGRAQAVQHEEKGGIRIGDIKQKVGKRVDTKHYHLTTEDITAMLGELTPRQLEVAKALQQFMAKRGAAWGNEVSMRRYGYNFYDEGDAYYPIRTDSNDRGMQDTEAMQNSMFRLLNLSASKSLNPKASNALLIGDIFDTFADHMADMAKLNGMGLPVLDAIKWFNYKERIDLGDGEYDTRTLQGAMEQAFGSQAQKYFRTLMKDINGMTEAGDRGTGLLLTFLGNYKAAAVAANLRVALLQPTSYVRASALISPKYLLQAFTSRNAYQEALEHSGTATWKAFGYYDTNISRGMREQIEHNDSLKDKIVEKSMVLAELGDKLTWGRLWVACKMQTKAQNKDLTGQALIDKTADLFREVIYATQVMDSTLTRSELMRGKTKSSKAMTAFMAEPTLSYNILMDAVSDYRLDVREKGKAGAWQRNSPKLAKSFAVYAASAAFSAVVESIADAFRDDDPEEFLEKFLNALLGEKGDNGLRKLLTGNLAQDLTIIGKLPYVKSMYSAAQGYKSKDMSSAAFDAIIDAVKIWDESIKLANGTLEKPTKVTYYGNMTTWGKIYKSLQALSQLTGVGVSNLTRDALALWNTSVGTVRPEWRITTYQSKSERTYLETVRPAGVSWGQYQKAIEGMDADANGSVKQDEAGPWLAAEVDAGRLTQEQAAAIWSAATSGKKSFEDWLEKNA